MSNLGLMSKLLDGVEIKWRKIKDIAEIYGGLRGKTKVDFEDGDNKYIPYINIFNNVEVDFDLLESVKVSVSEKQNKVCFGDVLFTASSESYDEVGLSSVVTKRIEHDVYLNSFSFGVRFDEKVPLAPDYLKFLFRSHWMRAEIVKTANGATRFNISQARFREIAIPIPCPDRPEKSLEIQYKIAKILNSFTELTSELVIELTARGKQYGYYREKLLRFEEDEVEWKTLEEVFDIKGGYTPSRANKEFWDGGTLPWFRMEDIRENGQILSDSIEKVTPSAVKGAGLFPANSIVVATSATIGVHALITVPYLSNQRFSNLSLKEKYKNDFDIKFLFYYGFILSEWCKHNTTMSSFASVDMSRFRKFKIPVPSLEEQARIVSILDKFDTLTNSITEGLPREIELRQKQYEYYRDLLLSFPKPETA